MEKKVLIIGAGIAGLAAGCYARMNGYQATIFELHNLPGGLCTAWERKGYTLDGCLHYLFGSGEGQPFNRMWQELGAVQNRTMINLSEYQQVTDGGNSLIVYADPDQLQEHMSALSPQDASLIDSFCDGVRQFTRFDMSAMYQQPRQGMNAEDWGDLGKAMLPYLPAVLKWGGLSCGEFASRFKHPFLQRSVGQMFSWEEAPVMMGMFLLAYMHNGNAAFPQGGSLEFARAIEKRFLELGGEIRYEAQVEKILVEQNIAVGVRLYNDEIHRGDIVISACDGYGTIFNMLGGEYTDKSIRKMYDGHLPVHSMMQVSLGVRRDLSGSPYRVTHLLDEAVLVAGEPRYEIGVKHFGFDPSLAPVVPLQNVAGPSTVAPHHRPVAGLPTVGKSVLELIIRSDYAYWQRIYGRRIYDEEQRQVSQILRDHLEQWHPGINAEIEVVDEATPLSYERYTGNWKGSTCGWLLTKETLPMMINGVPKTLPGLGNFYMAGQWVEPGGCVPMSAASGRNVIQLMCAADDKEFRTEMP